MQAGRIRKVYDPNTPSACVDTCSDEYQVWLYSSPECKGTAISPVTAGCASGIGELTVGGANIWYDAAGFFTNGNTFRATHSGSDATIVVNNLCTFKYTMDGSLNTPFNAANAVRPSGFLGMLLGASLVILIML